MSHLVPKLLVPLLIVRDGIAALAFYERAFGAVVEYRSVHALSGTLSHADLVIGDGRFAVTEDTGTPAVVQLYVEDVRNALDRALAAGAEIVHPFTEYRGERMARVRDPFGHFWLIRGEQAPRAPSPSRPEAALSIDVASASEIARRIREREVSSVEVIRHFITRIERSTINAVVVRDFERALAATAAPGPLHGVPVTLKESFDVAGLPTTCGDPGAIGKIAAVDSEVAARLRAAGAVIIGKTNVSANLAEFHTDNPVYGRTENPWDRSRGVGGSSGGSAAAVAAGLTSFDIGSDLGGSIRNPSHYCGVFGHKPTGGGGVDMAVVGPLARSAEDLALVMQILADRPLAPARPVLRVALWPDDDLVDPEIAAAIERIPGTHARPEFDVEEHRRVYRSRIMTGQGDADVFRDAWRSFFTKWDVLICPTMPTTAYPHDEPPPLSQVFWASLASLSYLPATVFPAELSSAGLPIGLQIIGPEGADLTTIEFAKALSPSGIVRP